MVNDEDELNESIEGLELDTDDQSDLDENEEATQEENNQDDTQDKTSEEGFEDDSSVSVQKKQTNVKKIAIIAGAVLLSLIVITAGLYFFGVFDSEPDPVESEKKEMAKEQDPNTQMPAIPQKPKYKFKVKDIDKRRLNRKLTILTKHEIILDNQTDKKQKEINTSSRNQKMQEEIEEKIQESKLKAENSIENKIKAEAEKKLAVQKKIEEQSTKQDINPVKEKITPKETQSKQEEPIQEETKEENIEPILEEPEAKENNESSVTENNDTQKNETTAKLQTVYEEIITDNQAAIEDNDRTMQTIIPGNDLIEEDKEEKEMIEQEEVFIDNSQEEMTNGMEDEETKQKNFLKFAQIATIKKNLYLSFLHQLKEIDKRISVCRSDANHIQIFVGPFMDDVERKSTLNRINQHIVKDAFAIDFTQEEFDKRCNF